jgi:hypothetical protein
VEGFSLLQCYDPEELACQGCTPGDLDPDWVEFGLFGIWRGDPQDVEFGKIIGEDLV